MSEVCGGVTFSVCRPQLNSKQKKGRFQILGIHTHTMSTNKKLAPDVQLEVLAKRTKNFSGAEIEGLVKVCGAFVFVFVVVLY